MTVRLCYKSHPTDDLKDDILPIVYNNNCHQCGRYVKVRYVETTHPQKESHH
jgi:hypothetical protein